MCSMARRAARALSSDFVVDPVDLYLVLVAVSRAGAGGGGRFEGAPDEAACDFIEVILCDLLRRIFG